MTQSTQTIDVGGTTVHGIGLDPETRCTHYNTDRDVIAIKFYCCDTYYPCIDCHDTSVDHPTQVWPRTEFDTKAILCGVCGTEHTITTYLDSGMACPSCDAAFNPGCRTHYHLYFETDPS